MSANSITMWLFAIGSVATLAACNITKTAEQSCYEAALANAETAERYVNAKHPMVEREWKEAYLAAGRWKNKVCPKD